MDAPLSTSILLANLLANAVAEFYIQFRVNRPKTLTGKILGDDFYDHPEIRVYNCTEYHRFRFGDRMQEFHCKRLKFKWKWPRHSRGYKFYLNVSFYTAYRPLSSVQSKALYKFSDIELDQIPAEQWIGATNLDKFPRFRATKEMVEFYEEKTRDWAAVVGDKTTHENLVRYLAAPDLSWASDPNLTASYLKAFIPYLAHVILDYDMYNTQRDKPLNISNAPLDWRGPRWLDWKLLEPLKKAYNMHRQSTHEMHGVWLWNPEVEHRLRKMIPVLTSKLIDPCLLPKIDTHFQAGDLIPKDRYPGSPRDVLCALYCHFLDYANRLYADRILWREMTRYLIPIKARVDGGACSGDRCVCRDEYSCTSHRLPWQLRLRLNWYNIMAYNETHRCSPEL